MTQHFDVAVIGTQTAGIIAAALLAKRGRRVVLVDHGENATFYRRGGLRLPLVPTLIPHLDGSPAFKQVHEELGLGPDLRAATAALEPTFQVVMPRHRLDVHPQREALLQEVRHEFPDVADAVSSFFERLSALDEEITALLGTTAPLAPRGLVERLRLRRPVSRAAHLSAPFEAHELFAGIPAEHPVREMLLGPLAFFGHLGAEAPSTLQAVRLIARYYGGAVAFSDRLGGLHAFLLKAAKDSGVEVQQGAVVDRIAVRKGRLEHLEVASSRIPITADFFVANTLGPFQDVLPPDKRQASYALGQQAVRPSGSLLVLNMVVRRDVIPCGMCDSVFLLNGRRAPRGEEGLDPPLFLRRYRARRGELGPVRGAEAMDDQEHEVLSVACPVRTADVARSPELLAALRSQIMQRVSRLVPFLSGFLTDSSLAVDTSGWDVETADVVRRVDPWSMHPIYEPLSAPVLGVAARPLRCAYGNLVHCGRDVVPGLGLEGEYITGIGAADALGRMAGRRWSAR